MDKLSPERRSANMRRIRSKHSSIELIVRRTVSRLGYRYRLHRPDLPGRPDLVFGKLKRVIFVHGCFWHCHGCAESHVPRSNTSYWEPKLRRNAERDRVHVTELRRMGWRVLILWECQLSDLVRLEKSLRKFLA